MIHPRVIDKPLSVIVAKFPRGLMPIMSFASNIIAPPTVVGLLVVIIVISALVGNDQLLAAGLITLLVSPLAEVLKLISRRTRPETLYVKNMRFKTFSFPSGHSYVAALVFGFLAVAAVLWLPFGWLIAVACISLAILVGISRVYLGAHFPSDVVAGWTLGAVAQYFIWLKVGL